MITTLSELLQRIARLGGREAFRYTNGLRSWRISYSDLLKKSGNCARYFQTRGIGKKDRIILLGENRPEWAAVFWAAVARGIQLVPLDFQSSPGFVRKISNETDPKLIVLGDEPDPPGLDLPALTYDDLNELSEAELEPVPVDPDDIVEIVYTSGTTSEPKGVVHRHRNICANLRPFAEEFEKFRFLAAPFQPIRLLNLLPLSHMFGQSMSLFIPPLLGGSSVFVPGLSPPSIIEAIRQERVSVLVAVPRIVDQLRQYVTKTYRAPGPGLQISGLPGVIVRWFRHRDFHSAAGMKFWAIVVGGATLSEELEQFWTSLGTLVIQGYGLTEASPIVALNHPFNTQKGSIGKPIKGQEVKISSEGEILIRGESVVSQYFGKAHLDDRVDSDGWLRTGDLGEYDRNGNLRFKGRKQDVIVTPEGLNVFPQDIEQTLESFPEILAAVVVGLSDEEGQEEVHAVLLLENEITKPDQLIERANRKLEPHQRIKSWSQWPERDFPRTPSTLKIDRRKILAKVSSKAGRDDSFLSSPRGSPPAWLKQLLVKLPDGAESSTAKDYDLELDLGLSSLDRIELLSQLQEQSSTQLDEISFSRLSTTGEVSRWLEERQRGQISQSPASQPGATPRWSRWLPIRVVRDAVQWILVGPLFRKFIDSSFTGLEQLKTISPPVIFAANHASNLDTIALLSALPYSWRTKLAPAVRQEYFAAHFHKNTFKWRARIRNSFEYFLACTIFNTFPLPQQTGGFQKTIRYMGELLENGYCPLVFPEGGRSRDGTIKPFKPGIGAMAIQLRVPVVPVYIGGLFEVLPRNSRWPRSGRCALRIGAALKFQRRMEPVQAAAKVEAAVRKLAFSERQASNESP